MVRYGVKEFEKNSSHALSLGKLKNLTVTDCSTNAGVGVAEAGGVYIREEQQMRILNVEATRPSN